MSTACVRSSTKWLPFKLVIPDSEQYKNMNNVYFKVSLPNGNFRRFSLPSKTTLGEFNAFVSNLVPNLPLCADFHYKDDERDTVHVSIEQEWQEAIRLGMQQQVLRIRMSKVNLVPPPPPMPFTLQNSIGKGMKKVEKAQRVATGRDLLLCQIREAATKKQAPKIQVQKVVASAFEQEHKVLSAMGFANRTTNEHLLQLHKGNVPKVLDALLSL